jgi:hypothetical protein
MVTLDMMSRVKHILEATETLLGDTTEPKAIDPALVEYVHRTLVELDDYEIVLRRGSRWRA